MLRWPADMFSTYSLAEGVSFLHMHILGALAPNTYSSKTRSGKNWRWWRGGCWPCLLLNHADHTRRVSPHPYCIRHRLMWSIPIPSSHDMVLSSTWKGTAFPLLGEFMREVTMSDLWFTKLVWMVCSQIWLMWFNSLIVWSSLPKGKIIREYQLQFKKIYDFDYSAGFTLTTLIIFFMFYGAFASFWKHRTSTILMAS